MREWGFIFCLRFRCHFFRHTDFLRFKISKRIFFLISNFRYHGKMYRLVPCIPIFRGFFIKSAKRMCICDYVENRIGSCKKYVFRFEKGYKWIMALGSPKSILLPHPYSILQNIGRVAIPKLVPRNCPRYLQTTLIMEEEDWSQNLCEVVWVSKSFTLIKKVIQCLYKNALAIWGNVKLNCFSEFTDEYPKQNPKQRIQRFRSNFKDICKKNLRNIVIGHLDITSIRN